MLFDTPVYFFFLAIVLLAYWQLKWRKQNILLLAASYFFYGWWDWRFLSLIWHLHNRRLLLRQSRSAQATGRLIARCYSASP